MHDFKYIGVMCGSSDACDKKYLDMAYSIGQELAENNFDIIYGGGARGLMRQVADGALENGGNVHGYMPSFMIDIEWQHPHLSNLHISADMAERKFKMMTESDATVFLPGGCGTMEEFFEWLSAKRLGKHLGPLIIYNFEGYYDPLIELLNRMEKERFHNKIHQKMWSECSKVSELIQTIKDAPQWDKSMITHASASKS